jgi:hypothetical protein
MMVRCINCNHVIVKIKCPNCDKESTHCPFCGLKIPQDGIKETAREGGTGGGRPSN